MALEGEEAVVFSDAATGELPMFQWTAFHTCSHDRPWLNLVGLSHKANTKQKDMS